MEVIQSAQNALIKKISKLKQKKYRDGAGQFLLEGSRAVLDSLSFAAGRIEKVLVKESSQEKFLPDLADHLHKVTLVSDSLLPKITDTIHGPGILAIADKPVQKLFPDNPYCIFLDRIRDPGNAGTIIRTAKAAGYDLVMAGCVDIYNPKVVRSCASALIKTNWIEGSITLLQALKEDGYRIISADVGGRNVYDTKIAGNLRKVCLVIGSEAEGIDPDILDLSDEKVRIPMEDMESLNAAVAAGILMYRIKFT